MKVFPKEFDPVTPDTDDLFKIRLKRELKGATISSVAWSISPEGPTLHDDSLADSDTTAQTWATDFTAGVRYTFKALVTTSDSRVIEARVPVRCLQGDEVD